jgi:hypothetical protein
MASGGNFVRKKKKADDLEISSEVIYISNDVQSKIYLHVNIYRDLNKKNITWSNSFWL